MIQLWLTEVHVVVGFLNSIHKSSQLCSTVECGVVIKIGRHSPISFKHVSLRCLVFDPHQTTYQSSVGVWLRHRAT